MKRFLNWFKAQSKRNRVALIVSPFLRPTEAPALHVFRHRLGPVRHGFRYRRHSVEASLARRPGPGHSDSSQPLRPRRSMPFQSGRPDLNRGPLVPQTSALTRLRHAPSVRHSISVPGLAATRVNRATSWAASQAMPQQAAATPRRPLMVSRPGISGRATESRDLLGGIASDAAAGCAKSLEPFGPGFGVSGLRGAS